MCGRFTLTDELYLFEVFDDAIEPLLASDFAFVQENFYSAAKVVREQKMFDKSVAAVQGLCEACVNIAPNAPPAAVIKMIRPPLISADSVWSANSVNVKRRARLSVHIATSADSSKAKFALLQSARRLARSRAGESH